MTLPLVVGDVLVLHWDVKVNPVGVKDTLMEAETKCINLTSLGKVSNFTVRVCILGQFRNLDCLCRTVQLHHWEGKILIRALSYKKKKTQMHSRKKVSIFHWLKWFIAYRFVSCWESCATARLQLRRTRSSPRTPVDYIRAPCLESTVLMCCAGHTQYFHCHGNSHHIVQILLKPKSAI